MVYTIPVVYSVKGYLAVKAETLDKAMDVATLCKHNKVNMMVVEGTNCQLGLYQNSEVYINEISDPE